MVSSHYTEGLTQLGQQTDGPSNALETFPAPKGITCIGFTGKELIANCPVTHHPDVYTIMITYLPKHHCLESKSLKLYLETFKDQFEFAEALAVRIANDLYKALTPLWVEVELQQNVRGGLVLS